MKNWGGKVSQFKDTRIYLFLKGRRKKRKGRKLNKLRVVVGQKKMGKKRGKEN